MAKITVTGIAQWAKVFEENRDLEGYQGQWKDTDGRCTINVILDEDNYSKVKKAGCMSNGKDDPQGRGMDIKFSRKFDTPNDWDGGAPQVYKSDGSLWNFETYGVFGNGSEVLVELDVYQNKNYGTTTTRLERVKVIKHLEYDSSAEKEDPFTQNISSTTEEVSSEEIPF